MSRQPAGTVPAMREASEGIGLPVVIVDVEIDVNDLPTMTAF